VSLAIPYLISGVHPADFVDSKSDSPTITNTHYDVVAGNIFCFESSGGCG
jgi:hypothetical protein